MRPSLAALFNLAGRTALVTGANRGIGLEAVSYTHLTLPTIYSV
mgnify:CR=1 FL=1